MAEARGDGLRLIGAGLLGRAMLNRLLASGGFRPRDIVECEPRGEKMRAYFGVTATPIAAPDDAAARALIMKAISDALSSMESVQRQAIS